MWGTDGEISLPTPPKKPILIQLGNTGFAFTTGGITHNVTASDIEELATPGWIPPTDLPFHKLTQNVRKD
jgi:hypothetical protein